MVVRYEALSCLRLRLGNVLQASRRYIDSLPADLRELYLPPAVRGEAFVPGRPVKGRNEPSTIGAVAWVVHKVKEEVSFQDFVDQGWRNTIELFGLNT